jgi:hypothetical protein
MEQDEIVYQSGDIIISKTLARFGGVTYPVNGIGSVYVMKPKRVGLFVVGIIAVIIGLALLPSKDSSVAGLVISVFGALMLLAAWRKPHKLMLRTASGDQQAYESTSKNDLFQIKAAIERAVVLRG